MHAEIQAFLDAHSRWSAFTRSCNRAWLERLQRFLSERGVSWQSCRSVDLEAYHQLLLWKTHSNGRFYSPNTINQGQCAIRAFYRWAHGAGHVRQDPTATWVLPNPQQPMQPTLTRDQTLQLLNAPDIGQATGMRDHVLLELLYSCQLSLPECRGLSLEQLKPDAIILGERRLLLPDHLVASIQRYLQFGRPKLLLDRPTPAVLLNLHGGPYQSLHGLRIVLRGYQTKLGLPWPISARLLHRSYRAHVVELTGRRLHLR